MGDDARGDEARRGGDPGRHIADARRSRRSPGSRGRAPCRHLGRRQRKVRRLYAPADANRGRRRAAGLASLRPPVERSRRVYAGRGDQCRRPAAALLHVGNDRKAQARAALPPVLSDRPPHDDVRNRPPARRRPSQCRLAGLGQARLELLLRALERRGDGVRLQPTGFQRQGPAAGDLATPGHLAVRAADGVADGDPGRPRIGAALPARSHRRGRTAQPGGHRQGPCRLGPDHPRLLRPDRDHRPDRQPARPAGQARFHGPPAARLPHSSRRRRGRQRSRRPDRHCARPRRPPA